MMPETGRLGAVRRFDAEGTSKDVVLLVSDADGWDSRAEDVGDCSGGIGPDGAGHRPEGFSGRHGQDRRYLFLPGQRPGGRQPAGSEGSSRSASTTRPPWSGSAPARRLPMRRVTESLPGTFSAGIGLDFCPVYLAPRPFCPDAPTTTSDEGGGRYRFGAAEKAQIPWAATAKAGCSADLMDAVMDHTPKAVRLDARPARWGEAVTEALDRIAGADAASGIADIPLVEIPGEAGKAGILRRCRYAGDLLVRRRRVARHRPRDRPGTGAVRHAGGRRQFPAVFLARTTPRGHRP